MRLLTSTVAAAAALITCANAQGTREVCLCPHEPVHVIKGQVDAHQSEGLQTLTMSGRQDVWEEYVEANLTIRTKEFEGIVTYEVPHDVDPHLVNRIETRVNFRGEKGRRRRDQWELQMAPVDSHPRAWQEIWDNMRVREWVWSYTTRRVNLQEPLSAYVKPDGTFDVRMLAALNNVENGLFDFIEVCLYVEAPPTARPSRAPSGRPTHAPVTPRPSHAPSARPTTKWPTAFPSKAPVTSRPTHAPSSRPTTAEPTSRPSIAKTTAPVAHPVATDAPVASPVSDEPVCLEPTALHEVEGAIGSFQTVDGLKTLDQSGTEQIYDKFVTFIPASGGSGVFEIDFDTSGSGGTPSEAQLNWNYLGQKPDFQEWFVDVFNVHSGQWETLGAANPPSVNGWASWTQLSATVSLPLSAGGVYVDHAGLVKLRYRSDTDFDASVLDWMQLCLVFEH